MLTLLVNAPTTGPVVRKLGLTRVPRVEMKALANIKAQVRRKAILEFKDLRALFEWDHHEESKLWQQWVVGKMTPLGGGHGGHHGSHARDNSSHVLVEHSLGGGGAQVQPDAAVKGGGEGQGEVTPQSPSLARLAQASDSDVSLSGIMMDMARTESETTATMKGSKMNRLKLVASKVRYTAALHEHARHSTTRHDRAAGFHSHHHTFHDRCKPLSTSSSIASVSASCAQCSAVTSSSTTTSWRARSSVDSRASR